MLELSNRERQIVFYLFSKPNSNAASIASIFNVSEKTIRNDIKTINKICKVDLIISSKKGFSINSDHEDLLGNIPLTQKNDNDNNKLLFELLSHEKNNIFILSDLLAFSETALLKHLNQIRPLLRKYDLSVIRKNNDLMLVGTGQNKRTFCIDMMLEEAGSNFYDPTRFQDYFKNIDLRNVADTFTSSLKKHNHTIPEFYLNHFLLNLYTILNFDFNEDNNLPSNVNQEIFDLAKETNDLLNKTNVNKINSIYNSLLGVLNTKPVELSNFEKEIYKITERVFNRYSLNVDINEFLQIFSRHIHDMIIRCRHKNSIQSDGGLSMKESCFFIYDVAVSLADEIAKKYGIEINENEISLISMHIGFLIEKSIDQELQNDTLNILVNVSQYISNKSYLSEIKKLIPFNVKLTILSDLNNFAEISNFDFLITTSKLNQSIPIPQCIISSILKNEDKMKIMDTANQVIHSKKINNFKTLFKLYFDPNSFFVDTTITKKNDILNYLCENLENQKIVDKEFKPSVFLREAIASTDITNMYAIPHAMDFIAKRTVISVFINPKGISWGDSNVKIVFLSAINRKNVTNLRILYDFLIDMVSNPSCFSKLIHAKSIEEFSNYLFEENK